MMTDEYTTTADEYMKPETAEEYAKPRKRKKRRKKRYLLKFLILIAVLTGVYFFLTSNIFNIDKISVLNNEHYTKEQIIKIAGVDVGDNLFEISSGKTEDKLFSDPYIKNCNTRKQFRDEFIIWVQERTEKVAVPYKGKYLILDDEGILLRNTAEEPTYPIIEGMHITYSKLGEPLEVEESSELVDTLELIKEVEINDLYFKKIEVSTVNIRAYIYDDFICMGTPENLKENIEPLKQMIQDLYAKGIQKGLIRMGSDGYRSYSPNIE